MTDPNAFPQFSLRRVASTASTQDVVRRAAVSGAAEGFCCIAGEQTAGRGRQGRTWSAPANSSLLASLLVRRRPAVAAGLPVAAGLALTDAVASLCGVTPRLKWPNDVVVDGRKLAGILCEVEPAASNRDRLAVAVGIGVNLTVPRFPPAVSGLSLHELATPPPPIVLLDAWLARLASRLLTLERSGLPGLRSAWLKRAAGIGSQVHAAWPDGGVTGIAANIDDDGALLISTGSGLVRVLAADVHVASWQSSGASEDSPRTVS